MNIRPNPSSSTIAAFVGQTYNTSVYLQLISGSVASISPTWQLQELNSSQTFLQGSNIGGLGSLVVGGQFERYNVSRVLTESATAFVTCRWGHSFVSGTTYSYTLRIGSPQLERFSVPTPMIATSTGAVTRLNESTNVVGLPPDFTVSRNTGATRVGPNGLIETAKTNLALQSEAWNVSPWVATSGSQGATVSGNVTTSPDGTTNADKLIESAVSGNHFCFQSLTLTSGTTYTASFFVKASERTRGRLRMTGSAAYWDVDFNLTSATVTGGTNSFIQNYGNGWYRIGATFTANQASNSFIVSLFDASGNNSYMGDGTSGLFVWGAQLEVGSTASEYIPTTTVARTRFAGVTVDGTIAANIPRIDWLGQSCPGLLVEASGTNQIRNNSMVGAVAGSPGTMPTNWAESLNGLVRQSVALGTENGVSYIDIRYSGTATGGSCAVLFETATQIVASTGQTWSNSVYLKIIAQPNPPVAYRLGMWEYNTSGTVFGGSFATAVVPTSTSLQRFTQTRALTGATTDRVRPLFDVSMTSGQSYDFTIRIGYPQMEQSSFATSVIPTTTGTGSRAADVISASGALVSGLIGQTEGTMYAEVDVRNISGLKAIIQLDNGTGDNRLLIQLSSPNTLNFFAANGGSVSTIASGTITTGTHKIAASYSSANVQIYMDGLFLASGTMANYPSLPLSNVSIGSRVFSGVQGNFLNDSIRAAALYTTRLTNDQLAELTRL